MGYIIGGLCFLLAAGLIGFGVGRASVPRAQRSQEGELKKAKKALADVHDVIAEGSLELSMLGSQVGKTAEDILNKYWRGDSK